MNIAEIIRKRRRAKDMTQEEIAEILGVSVSAVSLWESGKTAPDISLIPAICSVLEVSADELFGIDLEKKKEDIDKIIEEAHKSGGRGYSEDALAVIEKGLKKYPDSPHLLDKARHYHYRIYNFYKDTNPGTAQPHKEATISLGEKILEKCTELGFRSSATQTLCFIYREENPERAEELVNNMSRIYTSYEVLKTHIYKGDKAIEADQDLLLTTLDLMTQRMISNRKADFGELRYTLDEMALVHEKVIAVYNIIFDDGNFGFYHTRIMDSEMPLADYYAEKGDSEKTLEHLGNAAHHAIEFVKYAAMDEIIFGSLVIRGRKESGFTTTNPGNNALIVKDSMNNSRYDFVRDTDQFKEILASLDEYSGNWDKLN